MASKGTHRKLTAILSADVVGYSRLMGADEEATIETLTAYRKVFLSHIEGHRGRVVDAKGDAILAEFASVVDAVSSAVEIQQELAEKNAELSDDRRMDFRIGINLGDVVVKDDVIYGDGVNVAARLESLAEPGGICISRPVHDQVESKLKLECEYLGEQEVKNIAKPVRAYSIKITPSEGGKEVEQPEPISAQSLMPDGISLELPDRPSLAVLPFANMSGDPEQEYFSDGITEDLITDLSRLSRLLVIARNSSFQYKGQQVDVRKIGAELGVKYVLEGSVRKGGSRVRITAQLVETASGNHLWANRYDRELQDIFALQDEITSAIATELDVKLVEGEQARQWRREVQNLEAYDLAIRGRELFRNHTRADILRGRQLIERALELEPEFTHAMVLLGDSYAVEGLQGQAESSQACFDRAIELGNRAVALDKTLAQAHVLLAMAYINSGNFDQGEECAARALALSPEHPQVNAIISGVLVKLGKGKEALERIQAAFRTDPLPSPNYVRYLASAYRSLGRYDEAIAAFRKRLETNPDHFRAQIELTLAYMEAGREEEGRQQGLQVKRIDPNFSSGCNPFVASYKDPAERARFTELFRKAGLPE
jgi:TolB-like protein/class 3 adenylate cyclase/Tfp pilus assembly protein PilF